EWQQKLREEVLALKLATDAPTSFDNLEAMPLSEMAFKETLRIRPPAPSIPRRPVRAFTFRGFSIPAGVMVGVTPLFTHHMPEIGRAPYNCAPWASPGGARRARRVSAGVRWGGGRLLCLGWHSPYRRAKCFARHVLQTLDVSLPPAYKAEWQMWPIPKPRDGL